MRRGLTAFLTAEWRFLALLNYEIDPSLLRSYTPAGTELDSWNGKTFVSVVGFLFLDTKLFGLPIPFHRNFEEVNLRIYVRRKAAGEWRRGVVFVKEIVPSTAIAWTARLFYNENYVALPMRHTVEQPLHDPDTRRVAVEYRWLFQRQWNRLRVETAGAPRAMGAGTEEEFITEHYWGYAKQRDGGTVEYQVEHPRWQVWQAQKAELKCAAAALYGPEFSGALAGKPSSAFLADGSAVTVRKGSRLQTIA